MRSDLYTDTKHSYCDATRTNESSHIGSEIGEHCTIHLSLPLPLFRLARSIRNLRFSFGCLVVVLRARSESSSSDLWPPSNRVIGLPGRARRGIKAPSCPHTPTRSLIASRFNYDFDMTTVLVYSEILPLYSTFSAFLSVLRAPMISTDFHVA